MKKLFICISILSLGFIISSCDETSAPGSFMDDAPSITSIHIQPQAVQFTAGEDGFEDTSLIKDTTLTINLEAEVINVDDATAITFLLTNKLTGEIEQQGPLNFSNQAENTDIFTKQFQIETTTSSFEEYIVNLIANDGTGRGNFAQAILKITGISIHAPKVLEVDNPEEFQRPVSGSESVKFMAKVTDEDGQHTIKDVYLRLISQNTGEVNGSPFRLFDNGSSGGDEIANDSLYTLTLEVSSENQAETYDVQYYAVDFDSLVSDTVKTTFSIIE